MVELGASDLLDLGSFGTLTKEETIRSIELVGQHLIPALKDVTVE